MLLQHKKKIKKYSYYFTIEINRWEEKHHGFPISLLSFFFKAKVWWCQLCKHGTGNSFEGNLFLWEMMLWCISIAITNLLWLLQIKHGKVEMIFPRPGLLMFSPRFWRFPPLLRRQLGHCWGGKSAKTIGTLCASYGHRTNELVVFSYSLRYIIFWKCDIHL